MEELIYPTIIESSVKMGTPNQAIIIYQGLFVLKNRDEELIVDGTIKYNWFPDSGIHFEGASQNSKNKIKLEHFNESSELFINNLCVGKIFITNINTSDLNQNSFIRGATNGKAIFGDSSIPVEKIIFSVPNLRDLDGLPVIRYNNDSTSYHRNRLEFENDKYLIKIDKCFNYTSLQSDLKSHGGYIIQYYGELTGKKGSVKLTDIQDTLNCFNKFLSFVNGRRTSALFIQGIFKNEVQWCDYTAYIVDLYKYVKTWPQHYSIDGINKSWKKFNDLWQDKNDRNFLNSVIHWYVEANNQSGFVDGSIIMAQTALELIYNWLIIEKKGLLLGNDAENIAAANKIRLLLSQLNINNNIPFSFTNLQSYLSSNKEAKDAPDAIVQIRNSIVHSQAEKRKKLALIDNNTLYETLQLCLWYIEMSILYILEFNGKYYNRCSGATYLGEGDELVPWIKDN
ncbi:HEPN domain-containing protein [Runella salmonicolor]|uniref:ApeA N-terminal domain-containing protein n=1 Tax=Runella salmonicolor TaxID=2950278 RepID=A0ABT1FMI4_9BACT|nr:hypothetical protein [Runella salmonicolor]MCP1381768.1 hypothetical protein [Runella salmonicolor]